jgi:hypothetical protein
MNTSNQNQSDVLWNGEPWPDHLHSLLPRPSALVRANVYAAARTAAAHHAAQPGRYTLRGLLFGQWRAYAAWTVSACVLLAVCVWLGPAGQPVDPVSADAEFSSVVVAAADVLDQSTAPTSATVGYVDMGDVALLAELASIDNSLALLEAELLYDTPMSQNL